MFTISSQSDYGLIILSNLIKKKDFVPLTDLVKDTELPLRFLARIAAEMAKNGIFKSREGRDWGYMISPKIKKISLYSYLKIFEDDIGICKCCEKNYICQYQVICHHGKFLQNKLTKVLSDQLKKIKLIEIFNRDTY